MRRISLIVAFGICSAIALMGYPQIGYTLGLGKLRVDSGLGQPLELEIEIHSVTAAEVETLEVSLAARSDFSRAGVGYPEIAPFLVFELIQDSNNNYSILITTGEPVQDTFLHLLVSASWSGGRVIREYTALLDPPLYSGRAATDVTVAKLETTTSETDSGAISEAPEPDDGSLDSVAETIETVESVDAAASTGSGKEILVLSGDTLSGIVNNIDKPAGVSHYQALLAIYRNNPGAFIENNMNLLRKGAKLKVPSFAEMEAVTRSESMASFREQLNEFNDYRTTRNAVAQKPKTESSEETAQSVDSSTDSLAVQPEPAQTETILDTESELQGISTTGVQPTDATLTIGQQFEENQNVAAPGSSNPATSNDEIAALRSQLAQLDESLLASGVESDSVRQSLEQIQNQVERMSTLIQLEDTNLALAQSRAGQESTEVEARVEQLILEASQAVGEQQVSEVAPDPAASIEPEVLAEEEKDVVQQQGEMVQQDQEAGELIAPDSGVGQPDEVSIEAAVDTPMESTDSQPAQIVQTMGTDETGSGQAESDNVTEQDPGSISEETAGTPVRKVSQSSMFDSVRDIFSVLPEYGLKIAAGLLALIAGLFFWQRRKSRKEFDASMLDIETEEVSMNSETSIQRMSSATGIDLASGNDSALELTIGGGMSYLSEEGIGGVPDEDNEVIKAGAVDPLAEADVYLAYDRDEQAIQVLKEAYADNPERGELAEKLLEIYHKQDDRRSFDALAAELYRRRDTTHNFSWDKVRGMGREVSPDNNLYTTGPGAEDGVVNMELDGLIRDELEDELSGSTGDLEESDPDKTGLDISGAEPAISPPGGLDIDDIDLEIGQELAADKRDHGLDTPTLSQIVSQSVSDRIGAGDPIEAGETIDAKADPVDKDEEEDEVSLQTGDLEFDLGQDDHQFNQLEEESKRAIESSTVEATEPTEPAKHDLLAIGEDSALTEMSESSISKLEPYHESETALELAKAYIELGEQDIAKGFIEEVLNEGSEKQKGKARKLVRELAT